MKKGNLLEHEKINQYISSAQKSLVAWEDLREYELALCFLKLGNFPEAQEHFEKSILAMFRLKLIWWKMTAQVNILMESFTFSRRKDLYGVVLSELNAYRVLKHVGSSPLALSVYGLMEIMEPSGWDLPSIIQGLLRYPRFKNTYAIGNVIQAIVDNNISNFDSALMSLLKVHEGMAKHGALRESPEGFICASALAYAFAALKRGLETKIENEYLPMGYVHYLMGRSF